MPRTKSRVFRAGIYNLQPRVVSFPDHKKLLKKIGGG